MAAAVAAAWVAWAEWICNYRSNGSCESKKERASVRSFFLLRGEAGAANTWLERAYATRYGAMLLFKTHPLLRNLHSDPRYQALLGKMKMPDQI
jgi:hypothetical protein